MAYAGLDVGTSGCKMVVYNKDGEILYTARRTYEEFGDDGHREINPDLVVDRVLETIKEAASNSPEMIKGFAIASLGESVVCLDYEGKNLCNSMVTGDKRGIEEVKKLTSLIDKKEIFDITGLSASEMYGLPKYIWMNEQTGVFANTQYIFFYEDLIGYLLTGKRMVSYSSASRSMAFDINCNQWSEKLLKIAGISINQMSRPMPSGTIIGRVKKDMAEKLKLSNETVIIVGGHDQNCATLGGGVISSNIGQDGQGTCEVMSMLVTRSDQAEYMIGSDLAYVPYVLKDTFLTAVEITTCGILMNWSRDTIFEGIKNQCEKEGKNFFVHMDEEAEKEGISELFILPQFGSSGNPHINYDMKGMIWGLTVHTKLTEIYRALKESLAYQMLMAYETLGPLKIDLDTISITGGGAQSPFTMQLRADIFNKKILRLAHDESGTLGCMILTATALGEFENIRNAVEKVVKIKEIYQPDLKNHKIYKEKYKKYKKMYELMHNFG